MHPPLLLFDIDGTLLVGDNGGHHAAIVAALEDVYGVDLEGFSFMTLEPWGKTDLQIALDALAARGIADADAERHLPRWLAAADAHHARIVAAGAAPSPISAPGAADVLADLSTVAALGLVTGNVEGIARRKLFAAGLGRHLGDAPGGFGSDDRERATLVTLARHRAGDVDPHPPERTVIVGDTPRDVACARDGGVACVGVTTGPFDEAELGDADAVIGSLSDLAPALVGLGLPVR